MTALASSGRDPVPVAADEAAQAGPGFVVDPAPKAWRLGLGASVFLHGTAAAAILFSLTSVSSAERPTDADGFAAAVSTYQPLTPLPLVP